MIGKVAGPDFEPMTSVPDDAAADDRWMARCLELARQAGSADEVPVGAVVVLDDRPLGEGRNRVQQLRSRQAAALAPISALAPSSVLAPRSALPDLRCLVSVHWFQHSWAPGSCLKIAV